MWTTVTSRRLSVGPDPPETPALDAMPPAKVKAGSGFAAARAQLAASAKKTATSGHGTGATNSNIGSAASSKRSFDDDSTAARLLPPLAEEHRQLASRVSLSLSDAFDEMLQQVDEASDAIRETLRLLCCGSTAVSVSLLQPAQLVPSESSLLVVRVDISANIDGRTEPPCIIKLGSAAAIRAELQRASRLSSLISGEASAATLDLVAGPAGSGPISGMRFALSGGCWSLPDQMSRAAELAPLSTYGDHVACFLTEKAFSTGAAAAEQSAALSVPARLWQAGGPLARLASSGASPSGAIECRGEDGWASRCLSVLCLELSQQLLPGLKDGRRAALSADLHQPLLKELTRLISLKEVRGADLKRISWGAEPEWFEESPLSELACDESCESIVSVLQLLGQLAPSAPKLDAAAPVAWLAKYKPRVAPCHGALRATSILVDAKLSFWIVSDGGNGGSGVVGGGGASAAFAAADETSIASASFFDDAASLSVSMLVEALPLEEDDDTLATVHAAIDALIPVSGGDQLWRPRDAPMGASQALRRLLQLLSNILLQASRHAACSFTAPTELADLHPLHWLPPLLVYSLRKLRAAELSTARKKVAWKLALRAATALAVELSRPPEASAYAPSASSSEAALASILSTLRKESPVRDTRLILSCCQPLALTPDISTGGSARLSYVDAEGALLTSTGGRFGQAFDDLLASFRYDDFSAPHLRAHVAQIAFDEISEFDSAFTAVQSLFQQIHPRLHKLKARLGELAPLLFASASAKADQVRDAITAELVEALKGEKEEALSTACDGLRRAVSDTKQWCAARNAAKSVAMNKLKLEATERLGAGLMNIAHDLAIDKSKQRDILSDRCRVPRYLQADSQKSLHCALPLTSTPLSSCCSGTTVASASPSLSAPPPRHAGWTQRCCMAGPRSARLMLTARSLCGEAARRSSQVSAGHKPRRAQIGWKRC